MKLFFIAFIYIIFSLLLPLPISAQTPSPSPSVTPISSPSPTPSSLPNYSQLTLSEIMSCPETGQNEWIELQYPPNQALPLEQLTFADDAGTIWQGTDEIIPANQTYFVITLSSAKLNNTGDSVSLFDAWGGLLAKATLPNCPEKGQSFSQQQGSWVLGPASPNQANPTPLPSPTPSPSPSPSPATSPGASPSQNESPDQENENTTTASNTELDLSTQLSSANTSTSKLLNSNHLYPPNYLKNLILASSSANASLSADTPDKPQRLLRLATSPEIDLQPYLLTILAGTSLVLTGITIWCYFWGEQFLNSVLGKKLLLLTQMIYNSLLPHAKNPFSHPPPTSPTKTPESLQALP